MISFAVKLMTKIIKMKSKLFIEQINKYNINTNINEEVNK